MARPTAEDWDGDPEEFRRVMATLPEAEFRDFLDGLPEPALEAFLKDTASYDGAMPSTPLLQAQELDPKYQSRPHLEYLSDRIALAVEDVKAGTSRQLAISMPPRTGKSEMVSKYLPVWLLRMNPTWKLGLMSYSPTLAAAWSRDVRRFVETEGGKLGLEVATDAGAIGDWETTMGGEIHARSMGQGLTGFGVNVFIIDDPIKDYATAHSSSAREALWNKWTVDLQSRREPPSLTIVVQTRWHESDFIGRLKSKEYDGDPEDWEIISFPAIAEENDVLGREPGDPLLSPLLPPEREVALEWWAGLKKAMSSYQWASVYQQKPSPASGAIFNTDWWCYWTRDPSLISYDANGNADGRIILLPDLTSAALLDSWDLNFDDTVGSDFVVGQRWASLGPRRFLLDQRRRRMDFPATLKEFKDFNADGKVFKHLVEKKANGAAMISSLNDAFSGIKAVNPTASKEVRARAVTAEIESGHVYLPHPSEFPWVGDLQDELREFPTGAHDDQVDTLTQALNDMRAESGLGSVSIPGQMTGSFRNGPGRTASSPGRSGASGVPQNSRRISR